MTIQYSSRENFVEIGAIFYIESSAFRIQTIFMTIFTILTNPFFVSWVYQFWRAAINPDSKGLKSKNEFHPLNWVSWRSEEIKRWIKLFLAFDLITRWLKYWCEKWRLYAS